VSVGDCGLLCHCHEERLDRSVFAVGTPFVLACARELVPSLRLVVLQPSLPFLCCDSWLYPPSHRADVSVSSGFPRGLGFFGNPSLRELAVGCLLSGSTTRDNSRRVTPFRSGVLRSRRFVSIRRVEGVKSRAASMFSTPM